MGVSSRKRPRRRGVALGLAAALAAAAVIAGAPDQRDAAAARAGDDVDLGIVFPSTGFKAGPFSKVQDLMRLRISWAQIQRNCGQIRSGSFDWQRTDRLFSRFVGKGTPILLTVQGAPKCAAVKDPTVPGNHHQPKPAYWDEFGRFAVKVLERYGPEGTFTNADPYAECCGVVDLELWNEPNITRHWARPSGGTFVRFLQTVAKRVRASDASDGVSIVSGGLAASNGIGFVKEMYRRRGAKRWFDKLGLHTYHPTPGGALRFVNKVRRVMRKHGDRAPIAITEHGWSTCAKPSPRRSRGKCTSVRRQATKLKNYVNGLERRSSLGVDTFLWYTPQDLARKSNDRRCPREPKYQYGFFRLSGEAKPSWDVWLDLVDAPSDAKRHMRPVPRSFQVGCP